MPINLQAIRVLRLEADTLRSRIAAILDADDAAWDGRSDRDQERRLETAESVSEALCAVESQLDVELDRLLRELGSNGSDRPRLVVHCAAGRWVPGEAIATEGGGFRNIASMMPIAVLRDHIANLRDLMAKAEDPATMDEYAGRLEVAVDEELARVAGQLSPKPVPRVAAAPVQARGSEALGLMVGGVQASGGGYQITGPGRFSDMRDFAHEPGIAFARLAKLCAMSRGNSFEAMHHAKAMYPSDTRIFAALQQGVATGGGFLCPDDQAREMITLLRSRTIVRGNARVLPMRGTLTMPVQTSGVAANWIGESTDIPSSDVTFGQRRLVAHKLCALIAASNEIIRNSSPEADSFIRDKLVAALSSQEDLAFIRGSGIGAEPRGLRLWALTANVNNGSGAVSAAVIEADLLAMAARLSTGLKGNLQSPRWLMPSRTYYKIYSLRDATNGELLFPEIRAAEPRLLNHPVAVTDLIPINLSPGTVTEIYLVEFNSIMVGEDLAISVAVSDVASYRDAGSTLVSAFSRDETVLRAILSVDMVVARDEAVQVLTGAAVTY